MIIVILRRDGSKALKPLLHRPVAMTSPERNNNYKGEEKTIDVKMAANSPSTSIAETGPNIDCDAGKAGKTGARPALPPAPSEAKLLEKRKRILIQALHDHPERFWPLEDGASSAGGGKNGSSGQSTTHKKPKMTVSPEGSLMSDSNDDDVDDEVSPNANDQAYVKTIHEMARSLFQTKSVAASTGSGGRSDSQKLPSTNNATTAMGTPMDVVNTAKLSLLDRVQRQLQEKASALQNSQDSAGTNESATTRGNKSLATTDSSLASTPEERKKQQLAINVLGWLCQDLRRVVQAATLAQRQCVNMQKSTPKKEGKQNPMLPSGDDEEGQDASFLLCHENMSMGDPNDRDIAAIMENEAALMSGTEDVLALICREEGLFQGDVDDEGNTTVDPFKTLDGVLTAQQLAIIQETTRIIRTKTLALTGRRLEGAKHGSSQ